MLASEQTEQLICLLASWDREMLMRQFLAFRSTFPVDVTTEFMRQLSADQLRHVFLALCLQNQRLPEATAAAAQAA